MSMFNHQILEISTTDADAIASLRTRPESILLLNSRKHFLDVFLSHYDAA